MAQVSIVTYRRVAKIGHDDAMRFMCVGDSMTIGRAGDFTWRYRMWQHLAAAADGPHELVGPRTALYDADTGTASSSAYAADDFPPPARRHLAGWGEGWLHMAPLIADAVTAHRPDVLLVSLGLIDLGFYTDSAQTAENAGAFLTAAREANPHIRVVLLPVIPNIRAETDAPFAAECARFNDLLAKTVANRSTPPSPLLLASHPPAYDIHTSTYDGTHPNPTGEHHLAAAFADAMHEAWGVGGRYAGAAVAAAATSGTC
ncbi:GDSL-type esterase/lipase family protein [Streptomyces sp. NPDC057249]|uniref:GDSL-type esterase/lipase family protein n=1 Tax=Streptomyces sp. NPDC057249 TaxID=3346067 RepID=UPI00362764D5